jgi:GNAT superfamily N-acetyltransferase
VAAIAEAAFPAHYEDPVHFAERLALSPDWCFGLEGPGGALGGYLIAYPWPLGAVPPLNASLGRVERDGASLFLHDLALSPAASGQGLAQAIVQRLSAAAAAAGFHSIALVSVNGAEPFWRRHRFAPVAPAAEVAAKLTQYGEDARYMVRALSPRPR